MNADLLNRNSILENKRVLLLPFENQRHLELENIIFDATIWKYMGMYIQNQEDFENYISNTLQQREQNLSYPFIVIDKLNNKVAGSTRYGHINSASRKSEIGWTWYGKEFQGTGLNRACKYELLKYGFEEIGFRRIQFSADVENLRSQKAILNLGAKKEGIFRNNYIDAAENSRDDVYFSIINEEWPELKESHFSDMQ